MPLNPWHTSSWENKQKKLYVFKLLSVRIFVTWKGKDFLYLFLLFLIMYVGSVVHATEEARVLNPLELELQVTVNRLMWVLVLGIELENGKNSTCS